MSSYDRALTRATKTARERVAGLVSLLLAVAGLTLLPAGAAYAVYPSYTCTGNTVYALQQSTGVVVKVNSTTGATTAVSNGDLGTGNWNALALQGAGTEVWAFDRTNNKVAVTRTNHTSQTWSMPSNSLASSVVAGAINPATGIYYYAAGGSTWTVFAFDTVSKTAIGQVATISGAGLGVNGDFAFDASGNLYVVSNNNSSTGGTSGTLARVVGDLSTTPGSTNLGISVLTTTPAGNGQYHSMAFDSSGYLVIGTSTPQIIRVNPVTGAILDSSPMGFNFVDLASCAVPSTLMGQVDLPEGRYATGDQFTVTLGGGSLGSGNTGTTTGTDSGLQDQSAEEAGPAVVIPGSTYTVTQTASGTTSLTNYTTTWTCENADGTLLSSGTGNTATVTMGSTAGSEVTCTFTNTPLRPAIDLVKTAGAVNDLDGNGADAGDTITYSFKVTNTGNVTLNPVTVHDPLFGGASPNVTCPAGALAPGASVTCSTKTYTLTQADVDAGKRENTATATGTATNGVKVADPDSSSTPIAAFPAILLVKTAGAVNDLDGIGADAGDTITYSFKVTNTGNVTLNPVTVHDPLFGGASPNVTCPAGPLAPGDSVTCSTRTYTLTQADVDAGTVDNTATATGTAPSGVEVSDPDSATTPVAATPKVTLVKDASAIDDLDGNGPDAGDEITYSFTVENTGTVVLETIEVTDPLFADPSITCPAGPLAPGDSVTCSSRTYTLTVSDVDSGGVDNTATVLGTTADGRTATDDSSTTTPVVAVKADLVVTKSVDKDKPYAGETVTYTLTVTNEGGQAADNVVLTDVLPGGVTFVSAAPGTCSESGGTVTCDWPTLLGGESKTVTITATVDPVVTGGPDHDHLIDVQKAEVHMDLEPGEERTLSVTCPTGYVATDGSGRIDHVDQGTGTLASVGTVESRATALDTWTATLRNDAAGRAQAKVFAVCVKEVTEVNEAHAHELQLGDTVTASVDLSSGTATAVVECEPGYVPTRPGYVLDGTATAVTSYPVGDTSWEFVLDRGTGDATEGTVSVQCMLSELSEVDGHSHELDLREVTQNVTVQPGEVLEVTLTCPVGYKGIVAGWRLDEGLVNLGNDPRPIIRVFKLYNPTSGPLTADLWLGCLSTRTLAGAGNPTVLNTASATTTSTESSTSNNAASATLTVQSGSAPATPAPRVAVSGSKVTASVTCQVAVDCGGTATLLALKTQKVGGTTLKKGSVLARGSYTVDAGDKGKVVLKATKQGKKALGRVTRATLKLGVTTTKVTLR